jgi:RNA polymerase sigma-70 factor (ECF subfamily)
MPVRSRVYWSHVVDETSLIEAARRGDVAAFNELVLTYQNHVYNLAYRIMGDGDTAADATQEAFISAYRSISGFRGGSFKAWLLRIVTNACYDELRRQKRRPSSSLEALFVVDEAPDDPGLIAPPAENPEAYAQRQELWRFVEAGLVTLPADQRITLVLSDIEGMSYEEIAEVTSANLGTVKSRLSRARARLRDFLMSQGELLPSDYRLNGEMDGATPRTVRQ